MDDERVDMTIEELAERGDVPVRTIRFYIAEGLLPGPAGRGRGASYDAEHLLRLRLIRLLARRRVPLAEIREQLSGLDLATIRGLLAREERHDAELQRTVEAGSPRDYVAALLERARAAREDRPRRAGAGARVVRFGEPPQTLAESLPPMSAPAPDSAPAAEAWRRWTLATGVELHVRTDAQGEAHRLVARLLELAGILSQGIADSESPDEGGAQ